MSYIHQLHDHINSYIYNGDSVITGIEIASRNKLHLQLIEKDTLSIVLRKVKQFPSFLSFKKVLFIFYKLCILIFETFR